MPRIKFWQNLRTFWRKFGYPKILLVSNFGHLEGLQRPELQKASSTSSAKVNFFQILRQICSVFPQIVIVERANYNWPKNTIFTLCKLCKLCKHYVNSMVISCSTCQKDEKNALGSNMWLTQSCRNFNFVVIYAIFPPNPDSKIFRIDNKIMDYKSDKGFINLRFLQKLNW